jgi:hypothetical protein
MERHLAYLARNVPRYTSYPTAPHFIHISSDCPSMATHANIRAGRRRGSNRT